MIRIGTKIRFGLADTLILVKNLDHGLVSLNKIVELDVIIIGSLIIFHHQLISLDQYQ